MFFHAHFATASVCLTLLINLFTIRTDNIVLSFISYEILCTINKVRCVKSKSHFKMSWGTIHTNSEIKNVMYIFLVHFGSAYCLKGSNFLFIWHTVKFPFKSSAWLNKQYLWHHNCVSFVVMLKQNDFFTECSSLVIMLYIVTTVTCILLLPNFANGYKVAVLIWTNDKTLTRFMYYLLWIRALFVTD